jgi:hypothetical protein
MPKTSNSDTKDGCVFRVRVQASLKKMVDLPPMSIWDRLQSPETLLRARLSLHTRTKGFLFHNDSDEMWRQCLLSDRGYLIIYAKEAALKGYSLDVTQAKKMKFSSSKILSTKSNCKQYSPHLHTSVVTIKWSFGSVSLTLPTYGADRWRQTILNCFTGSPQRSSGSDTTPASTDAVNEGKKEVSTSSPTESVTQAPSKQPGDEDARPQPTKEEDGQQSHEHIPTQDQKKQSPQAIEQDHHSKDVASPSPDKESAEEDSSPSVQLFLTATAHIQIDQQQYEIIRQYFEGGASRSDNQDPK